MASTEKLAYHLVHSDPDINNSSCIQWSLDHGDWRFQIQAHAPGVFRLRCGPANWLEPAKPTTRMQRQADMLLARHEAIGEMQCQLDDAHNWILGQGEARLAIDAANNAFSLGLGDQTLIKITLDTQPHKQPPLNLWQLDIRQSQPAGIYGLGETLAELDRTGSKLCSDKASDRYLPLAWSPGGWGIYLNTLNLQEHDLSATDKYLIKAVDSGLDLFLFVGEPGEILNQYTALTGRAGQPNLWPMGVWLEQAPGQDSATSLQQVASLRKQGMALDCLQLAEPATLGFTDDKPVFQWAAHLPDWRGLVTAAEKLDLHLAGTSFPGVIAGTPLFAELEDRAWLLCDDNGDAWQHPGNASSGGKPFGLLDLSHKDCFKLWSERHQQAESEGLHAVACHAHYELPDNIEARSQESAAVLRNVYPHLARRALFDAVAGMRTPQEGIQISRDLFPGVQRFAWQQGPQVENTWAGYAATLKAALALGNSGVAVQTHKLGNAQADTKGMTAELFLRWLAMAVFSANFNLQGHPELMPDAFDAPTRSLIKHWLRWRYRLLPYVAGIIDDAVRTGLPVQRSMAQAYPDDPVAHGFDTQYLLGPALLLAPVMHSGNRTQIYLPKGDAWWDLSTGWRYEGGTLLELDCGLDSIPVFGREGHMLCLGLEVQHTGEINSARILEEVWLFGMPEHNPVVMRNKIRVMQMQGSSYIKGLEGLKILPSEGLEVKRRGAEVRISRAR